MVGGAHGLTPMDGVVYGSAYAEWLRQTHKRPLIVIGRDARTTGGMLADLMSAVVRAMGCSVLDLGLTTTPTLGFQVKTQQANGGIMISASHNPAEWNAFKFFNAQGTFLSPAEIQTIGERARHPTNFEYATYKEIGTHRLLQNALATHIEAIARLPLVNEAAIRRLNPRVAIHGMHSTGGVAIPMLLKRLGVKNLKVFHEEPTGLFPHNPEPLPEHIAPFCDEVANGAYMLGVVVDPDVDRLALVDEQGIPFGEEYTLVAVADYVLKHQKGPVVSNLSSTSALDEVAHMHGQKRYTSAIGEYHVVAKIKETEAVVGGEGNGGVIYPSLHMGRDALVGLALFLSHWAQSQQSISALRQRYPNYAIKKERWNSASSSVLELLFKELKAICKPTEVSEIDGLWMRSPLDDGWLHVRPSNTEPILRLYYEIQRPSAAPWIQQAKRLIAKRLQKANAFKKQTPSKSKRI